MHIVFRGVGSIPDVNLPVYVNAMMCSIFVIEYCLMFALANLLENLVQDVAFQNMPKPESGRDGIIIELEDSRKICHLEVCA